MLHHQSYHMSGTVRKGHKSGEGRGLEGGLQTAALSQIVFSQSRVDRIMGVLLTGFVVLWGWSHYGFVAYWVCGAMGFVALWDCRLIGLQHGYAAYWVCRIMGFFTYWDCR